MGNPRWLVFVGQSAREDRPVQRKNSGDLQSVFRVLIGAFVCGNYPTDAEERTTERMRVNSAQHSQRARKRACSQQLRLENIMFHRALDRVSKRSFFSSGKSLTLD